MEVNTGAQAGASFQHMAQVLIRRARISRGLQRHQSALCQMRSDRFPRVNDERNIRLTMGTERRGYANDYRLDFADPAELRGGRKMACACERCYLRARYMLNVT